MEKAKIFWETVDKDGNIHKGSLDDEKLKLSEIESKVFEAVKQFESCKLTMKVIWPNGSGKLAYYEKRGRAWIRTYCGSVKSSWLSWDFIFLLMVLAGFLFTVLRIYL